MSWGMVPYDPQWPRQYDAEAEQLRRVFGGELVAIHHVGSTSVPGMKAKPIVDIVIVVEDIARLPEFDERMIDLGYRPRGEAVGAFACPSRFYFNKPNADVRTHQAHVMQGGHPDIDDKLNFRDYLRTHPGEAQAYGALKERLTLENTTGIAEYMEGKDAFVKDIIAKAKQWEAQDGMPESQRS